MGDKNWLNNNSRELFEALSIINDPKDMAKFCRDLMTETEIEALSGRWQVAKLLNQGISQREASKKTGVSIATVTRVNRWLERGMGGYKRVLELINKNPKENHSHTKAD